MPRVCTICTHPSRADIDRALVADDSLRDIARQFGVSRSALERHKAAHLPQSLLEAVHAEELSDAIDVLGELKRCFKRINMLFDATHAWLTDPDDPEQYTLDYRAAEVSVIYTVPGPRGKPVQKRERLSVLLDKLEGKAVMYTEMRAADPRELLLKTANQLSSQLELVSELMTRAQMLERLEALEQRLMEAGR